MNSQQQEEALRQLIGEAWREVKEDENHRLRLMTRLKLYDTLIGDLDTPLFELIGRQARSFPVRSDGLRRYYRLGLVTIDYLFPIWERDMSRVEQMDPESKPLRRFPYTMRAYSQRLYQGETLETIRIEDKFWGEPPVWHGEIGNLSELILYTQLMIIRAVYDVFIAIHYNTLPIQVYGHSRFTEQTEDADLNYLQCKDFAYHACEAYASFDPNSYSIQEWQYHKERPVERDARQARKFWKWWLFEAIPGAAALDVSQSNLTS